MDMADDPQKVTISLPADALAFLQAESDRTGSTMADVVRRSIANEQFIQGGSQRRDVLVSEPGQPLSKLVFNE